MQAPKKEEKVSDEETNGEEENFAESQVEEVSQEAKEEEEWNKLQESSKKKEKIALEGIDKQTHTVYAPRYPQEKQEWWWVYMCDRKNHALLTAPIIIQNLREELEVEIICNLMIKGNSSFVSPASCNISDCIS